MGATPFERDWVPAGRPPQLGHHSRRFEGNRNPILGRGLATNKQPRAAPVIRPIPAYRDCMREVTQPPVTIIASNMQ